MHSLVTAGALSVRFVLISPDELRIPNFVRDEVLRKNNIEFEEVSSMNVFGNVNAGTFLTENAGWK
jgi:aspartate carbamoyltransferase catalytic subunit